MRDGAAAERNEYGLSEVVGFVLLLGVIIAAMALWMMYVVPIEGRENEISHMNDVKDRFTDYKITLDSVWINSPSGASYSQNGVLLSTSINLGTGGANTQATGLFLPLMDPVASSATLAVKDNLDTMSVSSDGPNGAWSQSYDMTVLEYQSQNHYWIQQYYYYQSGGVFLYQENGSICRVSPPLTFVNNSDFTHSVKVVPIKLNGVASMGGTGPVRVDSRMKALAQPKEMQNAWVNVSVTVGNYTTAKMWLDVFNSTRRIGGITDANDYIPGISSPDAPPPFTAFMKIIGPQTSDTYADVILMVQPVEYDVSLNSIASDYS
jgi:hypothetical protein